MQYAYVYAVISAAYRRREYDFSSTRVFVTAVPYFDDGKPKSQETNLLFRDVIDTYSDDNSAVDFEIFEIGIWLVRKNITRIMAKYW